MANKTRTISLEEEQLRGAFVREWREKRGHNIDVFKAMMGLEDNPRSTYTRKETADRSKFSDEEFLLAAHLLDIPVVAQQEYQRTIHDLYQELEDLYQELEEELLETESLSEFCQARLAQLDGWDNAKSLAQELGYKCPSLTQALKSPSLHAQKFQPLREALDVPKHEEVGRNDRLAEKVAKHFDNLCAKQIAAKQENWAGRVAAQSEEISASSSLLR